MADMSLSELVAAMSTAAAPDDLWPVTVRFLEARGVVRLGYHLHQPLQDGPGPTVFTHGFPDDWVRHYIDTRQMDRDPITELAARRQTPFYWKDVGSLTVLRPEQAEYLDLLHEADLGDGIAMRVHGPNLRYGYVGLGFGTGRPRLTGPVVEELRAAVQLMHLRVCELTQDRLALQRDLSPREREVLGWIARGKSNAIIAEIVGVSPHTVDTLVRRIFDKLDVTDRTTATLRGLGVGVVDIDRTDPT